MENGSASYKAMVDFLRDTDTVSPAAMLHSAVSDPSVTVRGGRRGWWKVVILMNTCSYIYFIYLFCAALLRKWQVLYFVLLH